MLAKSVYHHAIPEDILYLFLCSNADDEDEMLYGESDTSVFASSFTSTILTPQPPE